MRLRTLSISSILILSGFFAGCASLTAPPKRDSSAPPREKVFFESYESVWKATQLAITRYPMRINDMDSGVFETQYIRGEKAWISPVVEEAPTPGGQRYKLTIRVLKGKNAKGEPATKVTILKRAEIQRDFFSEFEHMPSDGLEEMSVMYRVERELEIDKALKKLKKN